MSKQSKRARFAALARRHREVRSWLATAGHMLCDHLEVPRGTYRLVVANAGSSRARAHLGVEA